jgi:ABC-2 type transport system permease protein
MQAYWTVFRARFRMLLQYRAAALAGFGTQLFWGGIRVMIFDAFYRSTTAPMPMTREQTITYLWLIQALLLLLPWHVDPDVREAIRSGSVAYELVRPTDLYWFWFSRAMAQRIAPMLLRAVPMFIVAGLFLGLQPPASLASALAWLASSMAAMLLSTALITIMTITMLWTIVGNGINRLLVAVINFASGSLVPLAFFPLWARRILNVLPFRGLMDIPFRLYVGDIPPGALWVNLAQQLLWVALLILLGRWLLARGRRRLVVQGG